MIPGSLWSRAQSASERALRSEHLQPIPTCRQTVFDGDARFEIRVIDNLRRKSRAGMRSPPDFNPFLPYEPEMYVGDVSPGHVCLLNKFNVVAHHLLIVTRHFEAQEQRLTAADFQALWRCILEADSLGFYNSGSDAGASQRHKHLQLVPLTDDFSISLEPLYELDAEPSGRLSGARGLPFEHRLARFDADEISDPDRAAAASLSRYDQAIAQMGWPDVTASTPYNLLVTRRWMLFVPRRTECFESVSLNALAFAGSMLVQDQSQLETLKTAGPMRALKQVTFAA